MNQPNQQPIQEPSFEPSSKPKLLLTIIISVLVTLIIVGLAMYFVMAKINSNNQEVLEKQIEYLQQKIKVLENQEQVKIDNDSSVADQFIAEIVVPAEDSIVQELENVKIYFNKKVKEETLNNDNFYVLWGIEDKVPATISYNPSVNYATLTFNKKMIATQNYEQADGITVVLNSNIKDLEGNSLVKKVFNIELAISNPVSDWQTYTNSEYGFKFDLPESWNRYSIVVDEWDGYISGAQGDETIEQGPKISIRHPGWTIQNPRQDIPIMVFTLSQWNSLQEGNFHIGAAPVGPSELGRNSRYVFALPARYNYALLTGYEEVGEILSNNSLRAF